MTKGLLLGGRGAFTLVELIVVVTILALLSTIGFVSYSSYLSGVRDTNRLSQLVAISDGLELYRTKKTLPIPDDNIEIRANGTVIGYQGYAGINVLETIDYSKIGKDPKDKIHFSYYLTQDKKHYQLLTYLEEEENLETNSNLFPKIHADTDYTNRYPKVSGKKLGILTQSGTNIPVQEVANLVSSGYLDIATTTDSYVARLTDDKNLSGTGINLQPLESLANIGGTISKDCKSLLNKETTLKSKDGVYLIDPTGTSLFTVYCDMTTDGGGWLKLKDRTTGWLSDEKKSTLDGMSEMMFHYDSGKTGKEHKYVFSEWATIGDDYQAINSMNELIDIILGKRTSGTPTRGRHTGTYFKFTGKNVGNNLDPCHTNEEIDYNLPYNFRSIFVEKENLQIHGQGTPSFWLAGGMMNTSTFQSCRCANVCEGTNTSTFTDVYIR